MKIVQQNDFFFKKTMEYVLKFWNRPKDLNMMIILTNIKFSTSKFKSIPTLPFIFSNFILFDQIYLPTKLITTLFKFIYFY